MSLRIGSTTQVKSTELTPVQSTKLTKTQALKGEQFGASKAGELAFAGAIMAARVNAKSPKVAPPQGISSSGNGTETTYSVGEPKRPNIVHDNGFLQNPKDKKDPKPIATTTPTDADKKYYEEQKSSAWKGSALIGAPLPGGIKDWIAGDNKKFLDSPDGIDAYRHFLEGKGKDRNFSYEKFVKDDASGKTTLKNATADLQKGVEDVYNQMIAKDPSLKGKPFTFKVTGGQIGVGSSTKFPYPDTDNWQKAIGGHSIWTSGTVTVTPPAKAGDKPTFKMNMTLHAEDRYNFNPKQKDIETGQPDDLRGRLEQVGLAKQYMNYSTLSRDVSWTQGNISGTTSKPTGSR
jgi:hypothetical protein